MEFNERSQSSDRDVPAEELRMSKEAWGAITAIAVALITAIVTLTTHFFSADDRDKEPSSSAAPAVTAPTGTTPAGTTPSSLNADAIAGTWRGSATDANGGAFEIEVTIAQHCGLNSHCGTISVSHVPCRGSIYLAAVQQGDYEFRVDNFEPPSTTACTPGAGEHFQLGPDGSLIYSSTYDPRATGTLSRQ
jgi:hypothetical protein